MNTVVQAVGLFVVTNIDDVILMAVVGVSVLIYPSD